MLPLAGKQGLDRPPERLSSGESITDQASRLTNHWNLFNDPKMGTLGTRKR